MSDWLGLENARVLLAGAGTIGAAVARGFVDAGARVVAADGNADRLDALAEELALAAALPADMSNGPACRALVDDAVAALGGLDVFVHCVGVNDRRPIDAYSDDDWDTIVAVNLSSAFWLAQAALAPMRAQQFGRIVFFSSVAGRLAHRNHGPYAATKAGLDQLARVMANENAAAGITVNTIAPGYTETHLTSAYLADEETRRHLLSLIPAGRFGTPEELVGPTLFLASKQANFVTAHVLYADGGRTAV